MKRTLLLVALACLLSFGFTATAWATETDNACAKTVNSQEACQPVAAPAWQNPYNDVKQSDWYFSALEFVCPKGLMQGISATEFAPASVISQAQAAAVFYRAAGEPAVLELLEFNDVKDGDNYAKALTWAISEGLMIADENGGFKFNDPVSREQLAVMMFAYQKIEVVTMVYNLGRFVDADQVSSAASTALNYYVGLGAFNGYADGSLRPQGLATRAEFAAFIYRCLK